MDHSFKWSVFGSSLFSGAWIFLGTILNTNGFENYGTATFVTMPLMAGMVSTFIYNLNSTKSLGKSYLTGALTLLICFILLMLFAFEGMICILMATPLAYAVQLIGTFLAWIIIKSIRNRKKITVVAFLVLPLHSLIEPLQTNVLTTFTPSTEIVIDAPAEKIWEQLTGYNSFDPPESWIMRAGIVYPLSTEMKYDSSNKAYLECKYSLGQSDLMIDSLVAGRLLRFTVAETPAPMRELSFYASVHAPHLHGNFTLLYGQIELIVLDQEHTKVVATSAYQHHIKPGMYWSQWSDFIFNQVHLAVLHGLKETSEL